MIQLTQSAARSLPVMLISDADHVAPKTGVAEGDVTVVVSKDGGALTGFTLTDKWTELGQGLYTIDFAIGDLNTVGFFAYLVTSADCDQYSGMMYVGAAAVDNAGIADAVWDEVLTGATHNDPTSSGRRLRQSADVLISREESCQAGGGDAEVILDDEASAVNDYYINDIVILTDGTGKGQSRHIDSYVGATKIAHVNRDWDTNPDATTNYTIRFDSTKHVHGLTAEALSEINTEIDSALDTAIPGAPTAGSINDVLGETYAAAAIAGAGAVAIQNELDDPEQFMADVSALALQANLEAVEERTDNLPDDPASEANLSTDHGDGSWEGTTGIIIEEE